jgi:FG-GAP repeat
MPTRLTIPGAVMVAVVCFSTALLIAPATRAGGSPAGPSDFNGDGLADLAVTGPFGEPFSRPNAGGVFVVFGRRGEPSDLDLAEIRDRALRIAGPEAGDTLGFAVDTLGDVNGDGGSDLAIGATAIDSAYLANGISTKPGRVHVVFGAAGAKAGAEITTDPGYLEERRRGCRIATNVQVLMEDNGYTDNEADPRRIRMGGMQTYVATPRNRGTVLGVTGFDEEDEELAVPIIEPTVLGPRETERLNGLLLRGVDGEDTFPGYPFMARTFANDNPGAQARILLVDGVLFRDMDEYSGLTEGNPPTYVIAVGSPEDRTRGDIRQMRRLARETKGRYYESRSPRQIERALQDIESRLRCDLETDDFFAEPDQGETEELADTEIEDATHTADVRLTWRDRRAGFEVERIDVIRGGDVVRRIDDEEIAAAYRERDATAAVSGGRGRTFRAIHVRGLQAGGRLRVIVRPQAGKRTGRVYGRVTQSRRRR